MNRRDAYRAWNREQAALSRFRRDLRRIALDVESLELDMAAATSEAARRRADALAGDLARNPRWRKTVDAFLLLRGYSKTPSGWRAACGTDVGLWRRTRGLPWDALWEAILESRKRRG